MCGSISGWAIWRISYYDELENFGWRYKLHSTVWKITWPIYYKFGTFYEFSFDMSGDGWNDYDSEMCGCGFSTEYPMCNGTHKVVKEIKDKIIAAIESIPTESNGAQLNALGMKMLAVDVVKKTKGI